MNFYIDFEATQFSNRIISIGCMSEKGDKFETLVKPVNGDKISQFITNLTGITNEMVKGAPSADEAFNALFDWVIEHGETGIPHYYCYGDGDFSFLANTIKYMTDVRAISFAISLKAQLVDYSKIAVKQLNLQSISLKKLYILLKEEEVEQHHDALEDAEMLRFCRQNLGIKEIDPQYFEVVYNKPSNKPAWKKNRAPKIFIDWGDDKWECDTGANENNYKIKCKSLKSHGREKYFPDLETAALWAIKFAGAKGSPKERAIIDRTMKNIQSHFGGNSYNYYWEENNETN